MSLDVLSRTTICQLAFIVTVPLRYVTVCCKSQFSAADTNTAQQLPCNVPSCKAHLYRSAADRRLISSAVQICEGASFKSKHKLAAHVARLVILAA